MYIIRTSLNVCWLIRGTGLVTRRFPVKINVIMGSEIISPRHSFTYNGCCSAVVINYCCWLLPFWFSDVLLASNFTLVVARSVWTEEWARPHEASRWFRSQRGWCSATAVLTFNLKTLREHSSCFNLKDMAVVHSTIVHSKAWMRPALVCHHLLSKRNRVPYFTFIFPKQNIRC